MKKKWTILNKTTFQENKVDKILEALLQNRGLKNKKQIDEFLNPIDPYSINFKLVGILERQIKAAIRRIEKAIKDKEKIVIYGDYDVDGICATAILWETLHNLGADVMPFIPNREDHGYGLNEKGIDEILSKYQPLTINHKSLIITVDNGIVAHGAVLYAKNKNIDVIVTDHHQKKQQPTPKGRQAATSIQHPVFDLPKAKAIVWSDGISGAGVAWFLAKQIYKHFHKTLKGFKASNSLELAAIGSITDMMPVLGVNRSIIKHGIDELRRSNRIGIKALCKDAGIDQDLADVYEVGFILGPRINAMGRLEDALESLRLLCTKNENRACDLAGKLGTTNRQRQQLTQTIFEHAKDKTKSQLKDKSRKLIFVAHKSYNQGVVGLVAGKLVEEFYKPAIILSIEGEYSKGSARSVNGFNIIEFLRKEKDLFADLGGHPMAAGFSIKTEKIKELEKRLQKKATKLLKKEMLLPEIKADLVLKLENINWELWKAIEKFSPFGLGNPKPTFVSYDVKLVNLRAVGREQKHLKLSFQPSIPKPEQVRLGAGINNQSLIIDAIAFNFGHVSNKFSTGQQTDICFNLLKNVWNGKESLELRIRDLK